MTETRWKTEKTFPGNYSTKVVEVLRAMSFSEGKNIRIIGSAGIRSIQYAGDYDAVERVDGTPHDFAVGLKQIVRRLLALPNVLIGDIKCGEVGDWRVLPESLSPNDKWDSAPMKEKIQWLRSRKVITPVEAKDALTLLGKSPSPAVYYAMKDAFKWHILRFTPHDVVEGVKHIHGKTVSLEDAIQSGGMTKVDTVALLEDSRYVEVSCVYEFYTHGKAISTIRKDFISELKESVLDKLIRGEIFKVFKRVFSITRLTGDTPLGLKLITVFNGDLGLLYSVISDIQMIRFLLSNNKKVSEERLKGEIEGFKSRLANIWELPEFIKAEPNFTKALSEASANPLEAEAILGRLEGQFQHLLDKESRRVFKKMGLLPVGKNFLP